MVSASIMLSQSVASPAAAYVESFNEWKAPVEKPDEDKAYAYDMILSFKNLADIMRRPESACSSAEAESGWRLWMKDQDVMKKLLDEKTIKVGIIGNYNRGKTTLLNLLTGRSAAFGNLVHTEGLSASITRNFVFLNTAGENQPVALKDFEDETKSKAVFNEKLLTCLFMQDMVVDVSDLLIVVVNQLTLEDQRFIRALEGKVKKQKQPKSIIVVHNLKEVEKQEDLDKLIKKDIRDAFGAEPEFNDESLQGTATFGLFGKKAKPHFYRAQNGFLTHTIIAKENSKVGRECNNASLDYIKEYLKGEYGKVVGMNKKESVLEGIGRYVQENLHFYFTNMYADDFDKETGKETGRRTLVRTLDSSRIYVRSTDGNADISLRQDGKVLEWEILWGSKKYKLDYEIVKNELEGISTLYIDVPGIFRQAPAEKILDTKDSKQHVYKWFEGDDLVLKLTVRLVHFGGKGPDIELWVKRKDLCEEVPCRGKRERMMETAVNRGECFVQIPMNDTQKTDSFEDAKVTLCDNGVLKVLLKHYVDPPIAESSSNWEDEKESQATGNHSEPNQPTHPSCTTNVMERRMLQTDACTDGTGCVNAALNPERVSSVGRCIWCAKRFNGAL